VRATSRPHLVQVSFSSRPHLPHISSMSRPHPRVLSAHLPISPHSSPYLPTSPPHLPISPPRARRRCLMTKHTHYYYGGRSGHARLVAVAVRKDGGQVVCGGVPGVWANRPRRARRGEVQANLHGELHGEMHHQGGSTVARRVFRAPHVNYTTEDESCRSIRSTRECEYGRIRSNAVHHQGGSTVACRDFRAPHTLVRIRSNAVHHQGGSTVACRDFRAPHT